MGFLLGMPDQTKEFLTLKRFVVDARSRANVYLKKINKNFERNVSLVKSRVLSALPWRVTPPDPHTASNEHNNSSSHFLWGRIWWVLEYKYRDHLLHSRDQQTSLGVTTKMPRRRLQPGRKVFPRIWLCHQASAQLVPKIILQYSFQILTSKDKQAKGHIQRFKKESGIPDLISAGRNRTGKVLFPW